MEVKELTNPSKAEITRMTDILTDAFWKTPMFRQYLFRGHRAQARAFLNALLWYSLKAGRTFVAEAEGEGIVACALWSLPDAPVMGIKTYLKTRMWPGMLSIALRSPAAMARINELFSFLEIYAPEIPCTALEFLASARKGAGAELLGSCIERFKGQTLYVESIVSKNDHAFYRQFGFEIFERANFHGTDYAFALIHSKCQMDE